MEPFKRTRDHQVIRAWVERHRGKPVEFMLGGEEEGLIDLDFGRYLSEDYQVLSWEEFFEWFDAHRLVFRYKELVPQGQAERWYNFVSWKNPSDPDEDETELPEVNELAEDNMDNEFEEPNEYKEAYFNSRKRF